MLYNWEGNSLINSSVTSVTPLTHGRVLTSWSHREGIESPRIALSWRERDGPVKPTPRRTGFGHVVLVQIVEHSLSGKVDLSYVEDSLSWSVEAPVDHLIEPDQQQT